MDFGKLQKSVMSAVKGDSIKESVGSIISTDEIEKFIRNDLADVIATKDKDKIIKAVTDKFGDKVDKKVINDIVAKFSK